jgi:hypothetical protein
MNKQILKGLFFVCFDIFCRGNTIKSLQGDKRHVVQEVRRLKQRLRLH